MRRQPKSFTGKHHDAVRRTDLEAPRADLDHAAAGVDEEDRLTGLAWHQHRGRSIADFDVELGLPRGAALSVDQRAHPEGTGIRRTRRSRADRVADAVETMDAAVQFRSPRQFARCDALGALFLVTARQVGMRAVAEG